MNMIPSEIEQQQHSEIRMSGNQKLTLIGIGISEVIFGSLSVILCIPTLTIATEHYRNCVGLPFFETTCYESVVYSLTSQGIWTGIFVIISGSINTDLGAKPNKTKVSMSVGFSTAAAFLSLIMLSLEAAAIDHHDPDSSDDLLNLHITLLIFSLLLLVFTLMTSGISLAVHGFWDWIIRVTNSCKKSLEDGTSETTGATVYAGEQHQPPTAPVGAWQQHTVYPESYHQLQTPSAVYQQQQYYKQQQHLPNMTANPNQGYQMN